MAALQSRIRKQFRRLGIDVVKYPWLTTFEGHLRAVTAAHRITVVLDIGAHKGEFALRARHGARFRGRIESFEPTPDTFETLSVVASGDDRWRVHRLALGSQNRDDVLHMFDRSDWNSLHELDDRHLRAAGVSVTGVGTTVVPVRRLDGVWSECIRSEDVVLLKSDTQGHELHVLAGAGRYIRSIKVVVLEASVTTFYQDEPSLSMILVKLADMGFSPSGFFPVTHRPDSLALDTVDVCFVR